MFPKIIELRLIIFSTWDSQSESGGFLSKIIKQFFFFGVTFF